MPHSDYSPDAYLQQLQAKKLRLQDLLSEFNAPEPQVFASAEQHYRLRAEFRLWREGDQRFYAMFAPGDNRTPIFVENFPIASERINQLMPRLKEAWSNNQALSERLFQVEFLTTLSGEADRKSTRLNSSHVRISYAVFCLKKKKKKNISNI